MLIDVCAGCYIFCVLAITVSVAHELYYSEYGGAWIWLWIWFLPFYIFFALPILFAYKMQEDLSNV